MRMVKRFCFRFSWLITRPGKSLMHFDILLSVCFLLNDILLLGIQFSVQAWTISRMSPIYRYLCFHVYINRTFVFDTSVLQRKPSEPNDLKALFCEHANWLLL